MFYLFLGVAIVFLLLAIVIMFITYLDEKLKLENNIGFIIWFLLLFITFVLIAAYNLQTS